MITTNKKHSPQAIVSELVQEVLRHFVKIMKDYSYAKWYLLGDNCYINF